jgi:hypothetical protein
MIQTLVLALAPLLAPATAPPGFQDPVPDINAVNDAIDKGVDFLVRMQEADGSFGSSRAYFPGDTTAGETALILAALLHSGLKWEHQAIQRGVAYVRQTQPHKYYGATTRLLMEEILLSHQDRDAMEKAAEFLVDGSSQGYWDYPGDTPDLSNTQYAILGLWLARQAKIKLPDKAFEKCMKVVLNHQLKDGGWAYFGPINSDPGQMDNTPRYSTASMTTAAMATVLFCYDALSEKKSNAKKYKSDVDECMESAYGWLDANMSYTKNVSLADGAPGDGGWYYYYMYNIERLATVGDKEILGGHNWYNLGATELVKAQMPNGSWGEQGNSTTDDTAFALLFLAKATLNTRTGEGVKRKSKFLFAEESDDLAVDLRIAPGPGCYAFVAQFGKNLREKYGVSGKFGLHVETVKYFVDGVLYKEIKTDVSKSSGNERYNVELELEPGPRTVEVELTIAPAPDKKGGEVSEERVKVRSARFNLEVDWTMTTDQETAMAEVGKNIALSNPPEISVSSERPFNNPNAAKGGVSLFIGDRAVDGSMAYGWVGSEDDRTPWIRMTWGKGIKVQTVILTPARLLPERAPMRMNIGELSAPRKVILKINGKETEHELEAGPRQRIELPKLASIKTLEIRVVDTHPSDSKFIGTGFAEVELLGKPKKKKKKR